MNKTIIALLHIGYWLLYSTLFFMLLFMMNRGPVWANLRLFALLESFIYIPALIGFYTFYTILFSRFLVRKKIPALIGVGLLVSFFASCTGVCVLWCVVHFKFPKSELAATITTLVIMMTINAVLNGLVGLAMRAFISWYGDIRWKEGLARKNVEMELALVKAQIDPHFLFNTLNNIDVLIEKDPAMASAYFKKLSGMLRFMLYENKAEKIPLSDELAYIEKYLDMQRIRSSRPGYIQYAVEGKAEYVQIAPMVFIPFIENAFKHADSKKQVVVRFEIAGNDITFNCSNWYNPGMAGTAGGLGNNLIQKRLELLYPGRHQLNIQSADHQYTVNLKLTL